MRHCALPRLRPGFTLIEILVVIVILGIVAGFATALVGPDERDVTLRAARRFAGALEYATQRAQWHDEMLGVSADRQGLRYWARDAETQRWVALAGDNVLAPQALPDPVRATAIAFSGHAIAPDAIVPLRASGRNEPFAFALATPHWRAVIRLDPLNRVAIDGPSEVVP